MTSTLRLYDTATHEVRDFVPLVEGKVGIYHCGLTVQGAPHIGHIRKEVVFDVLRRWLERSGHEVTVIANLTDIDDKILVKAAESGVAVVRPGVRERASPARRVPRAGLPPAHLRAARHRPHPRDGRADVRAGRGRARLPGR